MLIKILLKLKSHRREKNLLQAVSWKTITPHSSPFITITNQRWLHEPIKNHLCKTYLNPITKGRPSFLQLQRLGFAILISIGRKFNYISLWVQFENAGYFRRLLTYDSSQVHVFTSSCYMWCLLREYQDRRFAFSRWKFRQF